MFTITAVRTTITVSKFSYKGKNMVLPIESYGNGSQEQMQGVLKPQTFVRPQPNEEGVFILERGERCSVISQGCARIGNAAVHYTYERPLETDDPVPLVVVPGYGGIKPAYKELRKSLVDAGKPAITFRAPRTQARFAALHPKHFFHPERLLAQAVIAVSRDVIETNRDDNEFDQVDIAGHSMGGPAVINAGLVRPNLFRTVTAMASAGLDGHTLGDMRARTPAVIFDEVLPVLKDLQLRKDYRTVKHAVHYIARNPWRTVAEALAVSSGDIRDKVTHLGSLGVRTAALQFESDHFFPVEGVEAHSADRFDIFRIFSDPNANHVWPQLQPSAVANELVAVINELKHKEKQPLG